MSVRTAGQRLVPSCNTTSTVTVRVVIREIGAAPPSPAFTLKRQVGGNIVSMDRVRGTGIEETDQ